jgi:Na+:H+ antiporter, NhaC family
MNTKDQAIPPLGKALIPVLFLIAMLSVNVIGIYGDNAILGSNQMILLLSGGVAALVGYLEGFSWKQMEQGISESITATAPAIVILLLIGALAGTWMISGIVPAMIYYGLKILSPVIFLFAACIICSLVSVASGSSWSTVATVGIALFGIGKALGFHEPLIAGAIISGAYFGDKISPLSDTTNLAAAMARTDLFRHISYMMNTTIPSYALALLIFLIIGFNTKASGTAEEIDTALKALKATFHISPVLFLAPATVILLIIKKVPAIPSLLVGALLGGLFAIIFQSHIIAQLITDAATPFQMYYRAIMDAMTVEVLIPSDNKLLSGLLSSKGMSGMLGTVWLIISAMVFGGIMEACGFLKSITLGFLRLVKTDASLVGATAATCISVNVLASDQYLSIVVPGKMFADAYKERGLAPENLSRTLEDSGTVTGVLIPWNTCGAYQSGILGVSTFAYLPFCFFNLFSPLMTILFAVLKIRIARLTDNKA